MRRITDPSIAAGPPWRDQLADTQEQEMYERERWEEENCICEDPTVAELVDRLCPCHGDPEVIGS